MTNALTFTLNLQNAGFQSAGKDSLALVKSLKATAVGSAAAFESSAVVSHSAKGLKALTSLSGVMSQIGFQVAPQATSAVHTVAGGLKALQIGGAALGLGMGSVVTIAASAALSITALTEGIKALKARAEETKSGLNLLTGEQNLGNRLRDMIDQAVKNAKLPPEKAAEYRSYLATANREARATMDAAGDDPEKQKAARALAAQNLSYAQQWVREKLKGVVASEAELKANFSLYELNKKYTEESLTGEDKARFKIEQRRLARLAEIQAASDAAGRAKDNPALIAAYASARAANAADLAELAIKPATQPSQFTLPVTNLERMGGVFNGGLSGPDHARKTADNTAKTVTVLTQIKDKLVSGQTFLAE